MNKNEQITHIIRRLRRRLGDALQDLDTLEAALPTADPEPRPPGRRNKYQQQIADNEAVGSWRKPDALKKKGKGGPWRRDLK